MSDDMTPFPMPGLPPDYLDLVPRHKLTPEQLAKEGHSPRHMTFGALQPWDREPLGPFEQVRPDSGTTQITSR